MQLPLKTLFNDSLIMVRYCIQGTADIRIKTHVAIKLTLGRTWNSSGVLGCPYLAWDIDTLENVQKPVTKLVYG